MSTPSHSAEPMRLERPLADRKVSGVCAAIARHQRIDPTVVRVAAVALVLFGGLGFVAYFAGLLLIPGEGSAEPLIRDGLDGPERNKVILLGVLSAIALFGFTSGPFGFLDGHGGAWPAVAFVALVAFLVLRRDGDKPPTATADPGATAVTAVAAGVPAPPRRTGRSAAIAGAALLVLAATGGVFAAAGGDVRWDIAICCAVIAIGVGLVVSAPFGGARILVPFGLFLALLSGGAAAADLTLRGGTGDRLERPAALARGTTEYHLAAGRLMIDLRDAALQPGITRVKAELGFGQIVVRVPDGVRVELDGHASAGDVQMLGRDENGLDARSDETLAGDTAGPVLRVDAHAGFGQVRFVNWDEALR